MTLAELNKALLIERFGPRPTASTPVHDDSAVTTARRRRELAEATREERRSA